MIYLTAIIFAQLAFGVYLVEAQKRHGELIRQVVAAGSPDLTLMCELTRDLCQRLQAPAVAVAEHAAQSIPDFAPQHVPMDDDEAHWASKEDLAEMLDGAG